MKEYKSKLDINEITGDIYRIKRNNRPILDRVFHACLLFAFVAILVYVYIQLFPLLMPTKQDAINAQKAFINPIELQTLKAEAHHACIKDVKTAEQANICNRLLEQ